MRVAAAFISAAFGVYFITILSFAIFAAAATSGPWFGSSASFVSYAVYLVAYLIVLIALPFFGLLLRRGSETGTSLGVLIGPMLVAACFVGAAAIMLPASDGFAQANFRLNTAVILTISYSSIGVALYAVAGFAFLYAQRRGVPLPV